MMAGFLRVINARSLKLEHVKIGEVRYAILSHRWQEEEVDFAQMQDPELRKTLKGYNKIQNVCLQARRDGLDYVWVDTCCINKQSDAELTEAINSMFRWYNCASLCYLYLFDVYGDLELLTVNGDPSELFERGWTLQELLAPEFVSIFDREWNCLGTKQTLSTVISSITNIDEAILHGENLSKRSIAQRMSWASKRKTTRIEDRAYSLLGIFGVYMPSLYGEGKNAFFRLQQEIIRQSDDHSIFAWHIQTDNQTSLLAPSPDVFANSKDIVPMRSRRGASPYSITNRGLFIKLMALPYTVDTYLVRLDCGEQDHGASTEAHLGMFLRRLREDDQYARVAHDGRTFTKARPKVWEMTGNNAAKSIEFYVKQDLSFLVDEAQDRVNGFRIMNRNIFQQNSSGTPLFRIGGQCTFDPESGIMSVKPGSGGTIGWIDMQDQDRQLKYIKLGFDLDYNPVCFLASSSGLETGGMGVFDRQGRFNRGSDGQIAQFTAEERAQWPSIIHRHPFDDLAWNEIRGTVAVPFPQHSGLFILRGDRLDGLHAQAGVLCTVRIKRGEWYGKIVWEVYLDGLANSMAGDFKGMFKRGNKSRTEVEGDNASSIFRQ